MIVTAGPRSVRLAAAADGRLRRCRECSAGAPRPTPWPRPTSITTSAPIWRSPGRAGSVCCVRPTDGALQRRDAADAAARGAAARRRRTASGRPISTPTATSISSLAPRDAPPVVLRNNGDGTFAAREPFAAAGARPRVRLGGPRRRRRARRGVRGRLGARARLHQPARRRVPERDRAGQLRPGALRSRRRRSRAMRCSICSCSRRDGTIARLSRRPGRRRLGRRPRSRASDLPRDRARRRPPVRRRPRQQRRQRSDRVRLRHATRVLLGGTGRGLRRAARAARARRAGSRPIWTATAGSSWSASRRTDSRARATGTGTKAYRWQAFRPRAATATGDQRINSFGIGGEVEVRTGTARAEADHHVAGRPRRPRRRSAAPKSSASPGRTACCSRSSRQRPNATVKAAQRLKGSCPWLFAWNGREMAFVTDLIWRSPLGLRINAQATADVLMTEDWVKVARRSARAARRRLRSAHHRGAVGDAFLRPDVADGRRSSRRHGGVRRRAVRRAAARAATSCRPVRCSRSRPPVTTPGRDVSASCAVATIAHLDFAGRGAYQGDHARRTSSSWSCQTRRRAPARSGWSRRAGSIRPTARSTSRSRQGAHAAPDGLSLEVADAAGRFRQVRTGSDSRRARTRRS